MKTTPGTRRGTYHWLGPSRSQYQIRPGLAPVVVVGVRQHWIQGDGVQVPVPGTVATTVPHQLFVRDQHQFANPNLNQESAVKC